MLVPPVKRHFRVHLESYMTTPKSAIPFDYHSHNSRCGHAIGNISDYIDAAISLGMQEFGVSDHGPAYFKEGDHAQPGTQMALSEFPLYCSEMRSLQQEYADRITVRAGVEADYIEGMEPLLESLLSQQPLDYVLGSVHYAGGSSIFRRDRWKTDSPDDVYTEYYRLVRAAAGTGFFDILSHLTAVEAYGPPISETLADQLYAETAEAVAAAGCVVEINASGYRKMGGNEPFPNRKMLRQLIKRGVPLTYGSDCHKPEEVGNNNGEVKSLLQELGVSLDSPHLITVHRSPILAYATD